ncbi:MAG: pepV [Clostridia bacterium]|jgi:succinyl-diaminopimelate desuccinylase|nr:pepV [Clostridia bacterium]
MDFEAIIESYRDEIVRSTQDLIKIKSIKAGAEPGMPYGRASYEALQYVLNLSERLGFQVKDIDGYAGTAEFGEGSETIGVLVHVDVVPEGEGWTFSPFSGEIHGGKLYGRGAIDDKGPTIAVLYALKAIQASGVKLNKKIRVVFGTDEESGFEGIKYYLSKEKAFDMGFTPDAQFPLISGEKGILLYKLSKRLKRNTAGAIQIKSISGGSAPNMVPGFCKVVLRIEDEKKSELEDLINQFKQHYGFEIAAEAKENLVTLKSSGRVAHASTPEEGLNAISIMMFFLEQLQIEDDELFEHIRIYNDKIGLLDNGKSFCANYCDEISGKMTLNVGLIEMNENNYNITMDIRYPISYQAEEIVKALHHEFTAAGYHMEQLFALDPIFFPEEHSLLQKLMKVYKNNTKDYENKPIVIGGATYARAMKNVIAFGPVFPGEIELAHKSDEYITLENLFKITKIYAEALVELAK